MSDASLYRQVYEQIVSGMHLDGVPFQLIGTPKDFVFATAPTGQMDPSAYQIISGMPNWSPLGNYSSSDAQFFDAAKSVFGHVTFKVSPEQQADQQRLQDMCTQKNNAVVAATSDMNQAYLSMKQNGGMVFAARYADLNAWLTNAPEATTYIASINNATKAYQRAIDMKLELENAAIPAELQNALNMMKRPDGDPASMSAPIGWIKVKDGTGMLRFQPEYKIDTTGGDWRAALTQGSQGAFAISLSASDNSADFKKSWAGGSAGIQTPFWGVSGGGGWEKSDIFNQDASTTVKVSMQSSTRVKVNPGDWYDGGFMSQLAKATQGPTGQGYTITAPWVAKGGQGSSSLFGQYGLAGSRVAELVLGFKPSFEITMGANTYQQNKQKFEASGGLRIGPFTFGGSGGHESEFTKSTAKMNTFSGGSTSENPQIIGVIVGFPGTNEA